MRTETITREIYTFDELSNEAKETAREWWRQDALNYDWWEFIFDNAKKIGVEIEQFDLGRSQLCEISINNSVGEVCSAIIRQFGKTSSIFHIAKNVYRMRHDGMPIDMDEFKRDLEHVFWLMLESEQEYLLSDECVDESIHCNEYEFTEDGKPA